jgi:hypothetical protein
VEGLEPPFLAERDFESGIVYYKRLYWRNIIRIFACMCKKMCNFGRFLTLFNGLRKATGALVPLPFDLYRQADSPSVDPS